MNRAAAVLVALVAVLAASSGSAATTAAAVDVELEEPADPFVEPLETRYTLPLSAAHRLNRVFRGESSEAVFCGGVSSSGELVVLRVPTTSSNRTTATYDAVECLDVVDEGPNVSLHTHTTGIRRASARDRRVLRETPLDISCIQSGELERGVSSELRCLRIRHGSVTRHHVTIEP